MARKLSEIWRNNLLRRFLRNEITEERTYFVLTLLTGISAGLLAVFLKWAVHELTALIGSSQPFTGKTLGIGAVFVFISGYLTTRHFPSTAGSGIPGVRVALAVFNGRLRIQATLAKLVTSILSLSSGFSLGREGPTVSITAGIGSFLGEFFHLSKKRVKALVATGAAGGIAAAFNTPMAAVVFTLEEVVGDLNAKVLGSIIISSVAAAVTASMLEGNQGTFTQVYYTLGDPIELLFYLAVGLLAAFTGPLWVKSVMALRKTNMRVFKGHRLTIMMITFFAIAGLSHVNPKVLGSGHHHIEEALLSLILDWKVLLGLFALKFIATTLCYSSGISGGLFMPTLLMGAMLGGFVGSISNAIFPELAGNTGAFALVGMGAYFAAVIRAPITSIIMIFEMTRDYNIILPLMISNIVAYAIASRIHQGSIYENISEQDGIHLPTREDNEILDTLVVEDAMVKEPITLSARMPIKEAIYKVRDSNISGYPILKNGILIGMVSKADIAQAYAKRKKGISTLEDICTKRLFKIYPDQSLLLAFHKLKQYHVSRLPVVSRINNKRIVGIITAEDIVNKFGYHIAEDYQGVASSKYSELKSTE